MNEAEGMLRSRGTRRPPRRTAIAVAAVAAGAVTVGALTVGIPAASSAPPTPPHGSWVQRFTHDLPKGAVGADGYFPGYRRMFAYPDGMRSTHGGRYRPSVVNSVRDGALTWTLPGGAVGSSVTIGPSAIGGEWSVRMRTEHIAGIHIANMLWPDNNVWPGRGGSGGEIDFPESDTAETHPYFAVVGAEGEMRLGRQLFRPLIPPRTPKSWRGWHVYTTQVVPGRSVTVYQDGRLIGRVTKNVPRTPLHEQFQVEPLGPVGGGRGRVQLSAVAYSPVLDLSTIRRVAP